MGRPQVLSPIPSNIPKKHNLKKNTDDMTPERDGTAKKGTLRGHALHDRRNAPRQRKASFSSVSSLEDKADAKGRRKVLGIHDAINSPVRPKHFDDNVAATGTTPSAKQRRSRHALVEIFSPVRAMRVARAGMKRKRGGGAMQATSTRPLPEAEPSAARPYFELSREGNQDDRAADARRPRNESRDASSSSLRRNLRAMQLSDQDEVLLDSNKPESSHSARSTRSTRSTCSLTHQQQLHDTEVTMASSASSRRSSHAKDEIDGENAAEDGQDCSEGECMRLLHQAPSWQLRRLNKSRLFKLHIRLGTFRASQWPEVATFNKQELVDGIIQARDEDEAATSICSSPHRFEDDDDDEAGDRTIDGTPQQLRNARRSSHASSPVVKRSATNSTIASMRSSDFTDETDNEQDDDAGQSDTDVANDAGGEETEVEPMKKSSRRRRNTYDSRSTAKINDGDDQGFLRGMQRAGAVPFPMRHDFSNEGSSTRSGGGSIISPARRRLRHKGSLAFAASSPVRTRAARTRNQSAATVMQGSSRPSGKASGTAGLPFAQQARPKQRTLGSNNSGDMVLDTVVTPATKRAKQQLSQRRTYRKRATATQQPSVAVHFSARETDDGDQSSSPSESDAAKVHDSEADVDANEQEESWEDASPTVSRRRYMRTPRKAKVRAQKLLHQTLEEDSEAMVENVLFNDPKDEESEGMSVDETVVDAYRAGRAASPLLSEMSWDDTAQRQAEVESDDNDDSNDGEEDDLDAPSEFDTNASPSKIRKLRNGKVRLPTVLLAGDAQTQAVRRGSNDTAKMKVASIDTEYSTASLNRMKRDRLLELCEQERIEHASDATRAMLIDALLEHRGGDRGSTASGRTELPMSASSTRTARPGSSLSGSTTSSNGAAGRRSGRRQGSSATTATVISEKPLLLRSGPLAPQTHSKPVTPVPTPGQNEEELNGLDLESLQLVDKEIPFSKLEKLEKIGSGGFKDVYVGKYHISKKTTKKVAIADIRDQLSEMDIKELTLLRDLKHENIVRFIGVCIPPPEMRLTACMIVSELCANGDLYDYIRNTEPPTDDEIFRIMLETARGLEYLHLRTPAIIHRDCKSTNVLITRARTAKINDFGLARVRNSTRSMIKSLVGTVNWQAVELWVPKPKYNEKVDVWSAAMTFWETLQWHLPERKYPFQDMNEHQIYQDVGQKKLRPPIVSIRRRYGSEIVDLLDRMWDHNPKLRPTMTEVCEEMERLLAMKREAVAAAAAVVTEARSTTRHASK